MIPFGFWGNKSFATNGLKLYYDFANSTSYPTTGSTVYNLAKPDFNGTISGATFDSGDSGGCFSFDGTDDRIETSPLSFYNSELWGPNQSWEVWFKTPSTARMRVMGMFDTLGSVSPARYFIAINQNNGDGQVTGYITTGIGDDDDGVFKQRVTSAAYNTGLSDGDWHQIVTTYQNTDVYVSNTDFATQAKIYLDGVEISPYTLYGETTQNNGAIVFGDVDYSVWIGGSNTRGTLGVPYNGKIGVVRGYNRALTQDEITLNLNQYKIRYGL